MSNPTTNYTIGGIDLSNIFQPLSLGTQINFNTGYILSDGRDLRSIFAAYISGDQASITNYTVTNRGDLNTIFAKYNIIPYIATGTYTTITISGYNTALQFTSGAGSITINISGVTLNYFIVGGGGTGGGFNLGGGIGTQSIVAFGGGGGGGQVQSNSISASPGTTYNLTVGNAGQNSSFNNITAVTGNSNITFSVPNLSNGASSNTNNGGTFGTSDQGAVIYYTGGGGGGSSGIGTPGPNNTTTSGGVGGVGTTFNGNTYGQGGQGGNLPGDGASGVGAGGGGGGFGGPRSAPSDRGYPGSAGVVILYFNI